MFCLLHSELKIRTDSDGEERVLAVEAMLELEIRIYEEGRGFSFTGCVYSGKGTSGGL